MRSRLSGLAIALAALLAPCATQYIWAEETPSASPAATATPTPAALSSQEIASSAKIDSVTIPTPGELLAALNKEAKPNWQSQYRSPIPTTYPSRPQIALNIGGLIADGYIAVEAEDSQQVKNIGKDIISLAKALGVSESVISRGNSIFDFADNNEWSALKEELEATQNEVKLAMEEQHDAELVSLVTLGGWIRGTEVITGYVSADYSPGAAKLLRQPAIIALMRSKIASLPEKVQDDPLIQEVKTKLGDLQNLVSFPSDKVPTPDDVKRVHDIAAELGRDVSNKKEAK